VHLGAAHLEVALLGSEEAAARGDGSIDEVDGSADAPSSVFNRMSRRSTRPLCGGVRGGGGEVCRGGGEVAMARC
jgi:hypothetical protein